MLYLHEQDFSISLTKVGYRPDQITFINNLAMFDLLNMIEAELEVPTGCIQHADLTWEQHVKCYVTSFVVLPNSFTILVTIVSDCLFIHKQEVDCVGPKQPLDGLFDT